MKISNEVANVISLANYIKELLFYETNCQLNDLINDR